MINSYNLGFICLLAIHAASTYAAELSSLPLTVSEVKSFRVDKRIVRVIRYNRVEMPLLELELIQAPKRKLLKKLAINTINIVFQNKPMVQDFSKAAAVDMENFRKDKNAIAFEVGYMPAEHTATYVYSSCVVAVTSDTLSAPVCKVLKWGDETVSK